LICPVCLGRHSRIIRRPRAGGQELAESTEKALTGNAYPLHQ
jgi:hypothetical protein